MQSSSSPQIVIVGGGPAGLAAAIAAAQSGARVVVCEQLDRPGVKLLATGGGRCNITNTLGRDEFIAAFGRQGRFIDPALDAMDNAGLRAFLATLGVPTATDPDGLHVYPASQQAVTVQSALWRRCRELGVETRTGVRVARLLMTDGKVAGVQTDGGEIAAGRVILASGGRGYPELGGCGVGYDLAGQAGHKIVTPTPALVPLTTAEHWTRPLAGLSLDCVRVRIDLPRQSAAGVVGEMIFTHHGISGPVVLDLSGDVAALLDRTKEPVPLRMDLSGGVQAAEWHRRLDRWNRDDGAKMLRTMLSRDVPHRLAEALIPEAGLPLDVRCSQASRARRDALVGLLTDAPLTVTATEGFRRAMVTRGGVTLKQVDPHTLQSRLLPGLFFAGEVLDLDGPSGGFNLQWAFSSGHLAGASAAAMAPHA
ncbi:MAG: aminoacetone oxidase family FAD-binding enzyme [Phycisphaerae bacterium]|nr:aminoacetone oxidase family FAD-binding enzyme [Phycisphaerae bacterium]